MQGETSTHRAMLKQGVRVRPKYHKKVQQGILDMFCTTKFVTGVCENLGENLDIQQVLQEAHKSLVHSNARGGVALLGSSATQKLMLF